MIVAVVMSWKRSWFVVLIVVLPERNYIIDVAGVWKTIGDVQMEQSQQREEH